MSQLTITTWRSSRWKRPSPNTPWATRTHQDWQLRHSSLRYASLMVSKTNSHFWDDGWNWFLFQEEKISVFVCLNFNWNLLLDDNYFSFPRCAQLRKSVDTESRVLFRLWCDLPPTEESKDGRGFVGAGGLKVQVGLQQVPEQGKALHL